MSNIPQYLQLHQHLKKLILNGTYPEASLLPSEHELSKMHSLNRLTVRNALRLLEEDGYIFKRQGKGSIVRRKRNSIGLLSVHAFDHSAGESCAEVATENIAGPYPRPWPEPFFFSLSTMEMRQGCVGIERKRLIGAKPVMLENTYILNYNLPGLCSEPLINNSLFTTLNRRYHLDITGMEQHLRALPGTAQEAQVLQMVQGLPILHIYRKYDTNRRGFHIYSSIRCNSAEHSLASISR
jgi:GntR family transcriptional regulator/GntR family frlABCD operon transcriptional regulator